MQLLLLQQVSAGSRLVCPVCVSRSSTLRVPRSQRGGEVVEPLVSEQWFVRMEPLATPALAAVEDGTTRILPERFAKVYKFWLENIKVSSDCYLWPKYSLR